MITFPETVLRKEKEKMNTTLSWIKAYVPDLDVHGSGVY